jgi:2'-5' RNA ligase
VLKYDIMGDNLNDTNEELKQFPFTSDYPDYHPHMTIAYLKPGKGKHYIDMLGKDHKEMWMAPQHAVYSRTNGEKLKIPVRID